MKLNQPEDDKNYVIFKLGEVVEVLPEKCAARVVFDDDDGLVSDPLPIVIPNSLKNQDFHLPDVGEDALCIFGTAGLEDGYILGSIYAGEVAPPDTSNDVRMVQFSDGSIFKFDRAVSTFDLIIGSSKVLIDPDNVTIETNSRVSIKSAATVDIAGTTAVNIQTAVLNLTVGGTQMSLNGSTATIATENLTFTGAVKIEGDLTVNGNQSTAGSGTFSGSVTASNIGG